MFFDIILLIFGLLLLFWGGDTLVRNTRRAAGLLGVSALVISLTIVAFATSAPELVVSSLASFQEQSGVALGNAIGSNIANIGLILGLAILIWPIKSDENVLRKEYPFLIIVSILLLLFAHNGELERYEGIILLLLFVTYVWYYFRSSKKSIGQKIKEVLPKDQSEYRKKIRNSVTFIVLAIAGLVIGSKLLVDSSVSIALSVGVSEFVIGVTIVALGTSLPELATIIASSVRKDSSVSLGTILGSNIFNIVFILGVAMIIHPITVPVSILRFDFIMMLLFTFALYPVLPERIRTFRFFGAIFIIWYIIYVAVKFII